MKVHRTVLLVSLVGFTFLAQPLFSMDPEQESDYSFAAPAPAPAPDSDDGSASSSMGDVGEELDPYHDWSQRYMHTLRIEPDVGSVTDAEYEDASKSLSLDQRPLPSEGQVYVGRSPHKKAAHRKREKERAFVGKGRMNYVRREGGGQAPFSEAYAVVQKGKPGARKHPKYTQVYDKKSKKMVDPIREGKKRDKRKMAVSDSDIVMDAGHGVDHGITITFKGSNSVD